MSGPTNTRLMSVPSNFNTKTSPLPNDLIPVFNELAPMHLLIGPSGRVLHIGPTLQKLTPMPVTGDVQFQMMIDIRRPRDIKTISDLLKANGQLLKADLISDPSINLKGGIITLPDEKGVLLNMRLGVSVQNTVAQYGLKGRDFSPADQTIDMLYLLEVQSALLKESNDLNNRLLKAKLHAEDLAETDALTGLSNRRALSAFLQRLVARRSFQGFALMSIDLDGFKKVNDQLGHAAGDTLLVAVAGVLISETRSFDMVARVGGDEFIIAFPELSSQTALRKIAKRIIAKLKQPMVIDQENCKISLSIGGNLSGHYKKPDIEHILNDTDRALYVAKKSPRRKFVFFHEIA